MLIHICEINMKKINKIIFLNMATVGFLCPILKFYGCGNSIISFIMGIFLGCLLVYVVDFTLKTIRESKISKFKRGNGSFLEQ
jgi:urea transporter